MNITKDLIVKPTHDEGPPPTNRSGWGHWLRGGLFFSALALLLSTWPANVTTNKSVPASLVPARRLQADQHLRSLAGTPSRADSGTSPKSTGGVQSGGAAQTHLSGGRIWLAGA